MDSGNSGSLQSSSGGGGGDGGGDVNPAAHYNPVPIVPPRTNFYDPTSFTQSLNPNPNPSPNPMYNLDSLWSGNPNPAYDPYPVGDNMNPDSGMEKLGAAAAAKNPKKRTRASRRAPTTVLTTDTTNFRQMVQEFTGIPNTPFSASSSSSNFSRRLDLYGGGTGTGTGTGISPVLPFRPSAQKIQLTATSNFHFPPSETHGRAKQPLSLSNLQNQMFPFQSLQQSSLPQQINATERENQRSEYSDAFLGSSSTSLKRWRGQNENLMNFEGRNGNSQNDVVGDHHPGNEDSWICPSD